MAARSQEQDLSAEGLQLGSALHDCLVRGVLVINRREQIVSCSPEAEQLLHFRPGTALHAPVSLLPGPLHNLIREVVVTQRSITAPALALWPAEKQPRRFHATAQPLALDGHQVDVLVVLSDVTDFLQLQQSLTRLDRLATIGTLSAGMAHEIKNALVAVKTFVDLLLEKNKDAELAEVVSREMNRVNQIVRQLLKFGGAPAPVRATVRLHDVLDHSLRMVQHQLDGKLISINRSFNATADAVHGDDCQLEQVFVNLFLNAIEATGANGCLTVATEFLASATSNGTPAEAGAKPVVRVTVADTGMGIPPENLDRLFEPFFTTKSHGTGLGLPITRRIVQEHEGLITVESEPNKGTKFSLIFPANHA